MASPPSLTRYLPHKSKKRVFPGTSSSSSSSFMEPDVIEIPPPTNRNSSLKSLKQKEVIIHEIIDVDQDEDDDIVMCDPKADTNRKGKEAFANISIGHSSAGKVDGFSYESYNLEDDYMDVYADDYVYDDDAYETLQSHFDNIDLPPGIEATIPWLPDPPQIKSKLTAASSSSSEKQLDSALLPHRSDASLLPKHWEPVGELPHTHLSIGPPTNKKISYVSTYSSEQGQWGPMHVPAGSRNKKNTVVSSSTTSSSSQAQSKATDIPVGMKPYKASRHTGSSYGDMFFFPGGTHHGAGAHNQLGSVNPFAGFVPFVNGSTLTPTSSGIQVGNGSHSFSQFPSGGLINDPRKIKQAALKPSKPYPLLNPFNHLGQMEDDLYTVENIGTTVRSSSCMEDVLKKFEDFKQFDTVEDHSDHYYSKNSPSTQPSKNWTKKVQEEWKILEKDLPDTIFVRVYESRMDLLRAVIVGAEGTPYHDGLFFFDVFFPSNYPSVPPNVYYHSGGLRINPNLYNTGKVCLSLLNTWSGGKNEKWIAGRSTMLQVLVSIQGLILNAKPYFNEPGYAAKDGTPEGEKASLQYNESTFILSLKTMVYSMRRPPKYFEDLVIGHFTKHARDILVSCKAYIEGVQVGCLVKGGVQDVDEGDKSCSSNFKDSVASFVKVLISAFEQIGVKGTEEFKYLAQKKSPDLPPAHKNYNPFLSYNVGDNYAYSSYI